MSSYASSSRRSSRSGEKTRKVKKSDCGLGAVIRTSTTVNNPGKKFFVCPNSLSDGPKCKYFRWVNEADDEEAHDAQSVEPVNEFSDCKQTMEFMILEIQYLQAEVKKLKTSLFYFGLFMVVVCVAIKM